MIKIHEYIKNLCRVILRRIKFPLQEDKSFLILKSLREVDQCISQIDLQYSNDDNLRSELSGICLDIDEIRSFDGLDPYSVEYYNKVLEFVELLRGAPYSIVDEGLNIDISNELSWGFPYGTQSYNTVGGYLIAYGYLIRVMALPAGSRILEVGCGTGSLSIHLARMGYRLTCLDINASNLDLITQVTKTFPNPINTVCTNMNEFSTHEPYDAVIFFESLHHSIDHSVLLERVKKWIIPTGKLILAAEPIIAEKSKLLPYAWGPRLDGESLRAIRKFGWMELGFTLEYLFGLLDRQGWQYIRHKSLESHWADVIVAQQSNIE